MNGFTILIQLGWCGFGASGGLVPELRLGLLRVAACRGWVMDAIDRYRTALRAATRALGGGA